MSQDVTAHRLGGISEECVRAHDLVGYQNQSAVQVAESHQVVQVLVELLLPVRQGAPSHILGPKVSYDGVHND